MFVWIWTGIVALCLILEFITTELVCVWFSISALIALILASCGVNIVWQVVVFVVVSLALLLGLRKICLKVLKNVDSKTNVETFSGKKIKLLSAITEQSAGTAKIGDIIYSCISQDGITIEADVVVEIVEISGNKLIVKKIKEI